ncbi:MAG: cupredoxin domain-containing protein [Chloroflexi bacterium]|nr:cupredoxin domain-containing protein [Chloroflexota bacterium]
MSGSHTRKSERKRTETRGQRVRRMARLGAFTAIVVAVVLAVTYLLAPVFAPTTAGIADIGKTQVVNLQAGMDGFDMQEIHIKAGEPVKVNLRSLDNEFHTDGGGRHQFAIDALGVNMIAPPMSVASATFTPTQPGTYTFYCDICCGGKANPAMNGTLIVEA